MNNDNLPANPTVNPTVGVNITGGSIQVGGDIVGRDKIVGYTAEQVSALLAQISATFQPRPFDGRCPYVGLDAFEEEDAARFFGREKLVAELVERVKASRFIVIAGPSGSGKSSLVRAGLIHTLKQGALPGSDCWLYASLKPGRDPIEQLALAISRMARSPDAGDYIRRHGMCDVDTLHKFAETMLSDKSDQRAVIMVDQFEELFTQVSREDEHVAFLNLLTRAATLENGRVTVLVVMRSDFVSNCATHPQLNALLNQQFFQVGAMQPEELVSAIALPALHVGLRVDPDLIAQIIHDMQDEPGALPLMQFALKDLFDARQAAGGVIALTLADYIARGGIRKSLERHADAAFARLSEAEQQLAHAIFTGLIQIGRGAQDTRRTATFEELVPAGADKAEVETVIRKLADARLVTTDEQAIGARTVTLAHEKLIDAWPWLHKLVNENRDAIALQNQIAQDAQEWEQHRRDSSYLYIGARLATAHEQLAANKIVLSGLAQAFVNAGIGAEETERQKEEARQRKELEDAQKLAEAEKQRAEEQAKARRWLQQLAVALGMLFLLSIIWVVFTILQANQNARLAKSNAEIASTAQSASTRAVAQQATAQANAAEAQRQATLALARQLAAQAVARVGSQFDLSLLLNLESLRLADTAEMRGNLLAGLQGQPQLLRYLRGYTGVAFSPDGKTLASASEDNTIILWNVATGQPLGPPLTGPTDGVSGVAFSPDGKTLALAGCGKEEVKSLTGRCTQGEIRLWDVATRQPLGPPLTEYTDSVDSVAFSAEGKTLASASCEKRYEEGGCAQSEICLWDVTTRQPLGPPLTGHTSIVQSVAFSPDGKTLASASWDKTIVLWDVTTRQPLGPPLTGHTSDVYSVAFSPDGKMLASASNDATIILWDVTTRQPLGPPLTGHTGSVNSVAFSPDGKTLASASNDATIILWDVTTRQPLGLPLTGHTDRVQSVAFSPDGKTLASAGADQIVILWDVSTALNTSLAARQSLGPPLTGHTSDVWSVAFSPDGKTLASGDDKNVILWDTATRQPLGSPLTGHTSAVSSVAFSPDGKTLASASYDNTIILWDVATHQPLGPPLTGHAEAVVSVAFSPDGRTLASVGLDSTIILWDVATRQPLGLPLTGTEYHKYVFSMALSPDGKTLALAGYPGTIVLWDVTTRQPLGPPLTGHTSVVESVAFSPDGKTLASATSWDKTIDLWDVATRQPLGPPLTGHTSDVYSVAFSPDGKTLASAGCGKEEVKSSEGRCTQGDIRLWDVATRQPVGPLLTRHTGSVNSVAFSPDGKTLASASRDKTIILWDVSVESWKARACEIVGRNLTRAEWESYLPGWEYHKTCEQWPEGK